LILESFMAPGGASAAALLLFRITGVVAVAPIFSGRYIPVQMKAAFTVLMVLLMLPAATAVAPADLRVTAGAIMTELLVGFTLGFAAGILIHAAEVAGDFVAVQTALSGANLLDPLSETQMPVLGQFMGITATAVFLSVGGHRVVLDATAVSLEIIPSGQLPRLEGILPLVELGSRMFALGLQMSAPVIGAVTIGNVALGVLARTVPQLNILMTAFPLQIGVGLLVLSVSLPLLGHLFAEWPAELRGISEDILIQMAPDPVEVP
jgi:flagellar biosynthetic protein FliR